MFLMVSCQPWYHHFTKKLEKRRFFACNDTALIAVVANVNCHNALKHLKGVGMETLLFHTNMSISKQCVVVHGSCPCVACGLLHQATASTTTTTEDEAPVAASSTNLGCRGEGCWGMRTRLTGRDTEVKVAHAQPYGPSLLFPAAPWRPYG
jgi:hypothetical protein